MGLRKKGKQTLGESQADIPAYLRDYSSSGYPAEHFADAVCTCGGRLFIRDFARLASGA